MLATLRGVKRFCYIQQFAFNGLNIDITTTLESSKKPGSLRLWLLLICNILLILAMCNYAWENVNDLVKISEALAPILQYTLCIIKILIFLFKRQNVTKLIRKIWTLSTQANTEELEIITHENSIDYIFSKLYYISIVILGSLSLIVPLLTSLVVYIKTQQLQFYQTFKASYPFDQTQPINYCITYCIDLGSVYFAGHAAVAIDTLYTWFVLNIAAQFRILKLKLKNASEKLTDDVVSMEYGIKCCLEYHQYILNIAKELNMLFRPILFAEFLVNGAQLCFLAYQFGSGNGMELKNLPFLISFFTAVLGQLIMYCYGGQRVQDESENIAAFIYLTFPWHSLAISSQKLLALFITRAQKCCELMGIFFTANWRLFIWVVQTNFSYISLLWTLDENKDN